MKAKIKSGFSAKGNITEGKWYEIKEIGDCFDENLGRSFEIDDNEGLNCYCLEHDCSWLCGGSWEIVKDV